uniref:NADH dehydrogenase subunit 5 n=1 Tax=Melecta chinensis TaxID=582934 RepID=UPI0025520646|nr:NADH dehydrogenase subunit 5 [Melecta chinensis]WFP44657.1 NADH dehydrogenase subunit 5 [Melecta chinensis]
MFMVVSGVILLMISLFLILMFFYTIYLNKLFVVSWMIYSSSSLKIEFVILMDEFSSLFLGMVSLITSVVVFYSVDYMSDVDWKKLSRFNYLVLLFMISMFLMVSSPTMFSILVGWDLLGLTSYCLVIYYQNMKALNAGFLTIMMNRVGDCMLLILIAMNLLNGSLNSFLDLKMNVLILIIMAFTKSAQLPFSSWLPAAMMAPTPISSLVHSSTLVTAGVYLLIRYNVFIDNNVTLYMMISSLTMVSSGLLANFENDFKKIIALSTLSQLGFMMSILLMKMYDLAFVHLIIHAMFKSLMFLCAGSMIHYLNGSQDLRDYSGIFFVYPFKSLILMFSMMSLCGFPFLAGFYSKDLIMEFMLMNNLNLFIVMNLVIATMFTVSYSVRILCTMMKFNHMKFVGLMVKENGWMNLYMMIMMILTIFFSKIYFNLKFLDYTLNLSLFMKLMVLKLCVLGVIFGVQLSLTSTLAVFFLSVMKNMFYLNKFLKMNYMFILKLIMDYDIYFDKLFMNIYNKEIYKSVMVLISQKSSVSFMNLLGLWVMVLIIFVILI